MQGTWDCAGDRGVVRTPGELDPVRMTVDGVRRGTAMQAGWVFLATAAYFGPFLAAGLVLLFDERWNWGRVLVVSIVYGGALAVAEVWQARRSGTPHARQTVRRAIAPGALPADAAPADLRPVLDRERERRQRERQLLPALFGVTAVLVAVVAATTDTAAWSLWLYAAAVGTAALAAPAWLGRRVRAVERIAQQLDEVRPAG